MKKLILTLSIAASAYFSSFAQWQDGTHIYNTNSGNVGIGTSTPASKLSVDGGDLQIENGQGRFKGWYNYNSGSGQAAEIGLSGSTVYIYNSQRPLFSEAGDIQIGGAVAGGLTVKQTTGNVGIGTSSPLENFSVIAPNNSTNQIGFGLVGEQKSALYHSNANGLMVYSSINAGANHPMHFLTGGVTADERITILGDGNVGIGKTNPGEKLEVAGNLLVTGINGLILNTPGGGAIDNQTGNLFFQKANGAGFIFRNTGPTYTEYMRINPLGNLLIGKISQDNPTYKLDIGGKARADEIVVNSNGADFVFEPDYTLPKLSEIKSFIDQNHHLPQIPSAKEMQKNGLSVGELNTKLLQKVEELTLYLIEKDIKDKEKDAQLLSQQDQINQLKEQVTNLVKAKN